MPRKEFHRSAFSRLRMLAIRLWQDESGVEALEFSLVAMPFLMMIFIMIETSLLTLQSSVLGGGLLSAERLIFSGQAQDSKQNYKPPGGTLYTSDTFLDKIHDDYFPILSRSKMVVSIFPIGSFSAGKTLAPLIFTDNGACTNCLFDTGGSGAVVAFQIGYWWVPVTPGLDAMLGVTLNQRLQFSMVFQNEPFTAANQAPINAGSSP